MDWVLKKSDAVACPVLNHASSFPVNNIYCVGRNYSEHAKEMGGNPDREPPFFFHKISEVLLPPGNNLEFPEWNLKLSPHLHLVDFFRMNYVHLIETLNANEEELFQCL